MTPWIVDTEVYPNLFTAVFKNESYKVFTLWEDIDEMEDLRKFLKNPENIFIGYNTVDFDGVILQSILSDPDITASALCRIRDAAIASVFPLIHPSQREFKEIDLYRIWHYNNHARATSLKWLEFVLRMRSIKDLPYDHNKIIKSSRQKDAIIKYCKYDVDVTEIFYQKTKTKIKSRFEVSSKFGFDATNMSDSSMGEKIILKALGKYNPNGTQRDKIAVKDLILPLYRQIRMFPDVLNHFDSIVLESEKKGKRKVFNVKGNLHEFEWEGMEVVVGMGGIHGCTDKGFYKSTEDRLIVSADVTSHYPNSVIVNRFYPEHLGERFVDIYDKDVYRERAKYPKKTHFTMNQTYKLACNAAVGKFKSQYSPLYDPAANLKVTINNQLSILLIAHLLKRGIPDIQFLMLNTDGFEASIPKKYVKRFRRICEKWEKLTGFQLEHTDYQKLAIYNVNNYIALNSLGKVKRKGLFCTYEDYVNQEDFHKNPSATIIPKALSAYFIDSVPIEQTINNERDIFEFLYGVKKTRSFNYVLLIADDSRQIDIKKFKERVFRYYVSTSDKAGNLFKLWKDGRLNAVNKGDLIVSAISLRSTDANKFSDLDREYYIAKAHEIRSEIEYDKSRSKNSGISPSEIQGGVSDNTQRT